MEVGCGIANTSTALEINEDKKELIVALKKIPTIIKERIIHVVFLADRINSVNKTKKLCVHVWSVYSSFRKRLIFAYEQNQWNLAGIGAGSTCLHRV